MNDVKESVFEMEETSNVRYDYIYFFPPIIMVISFKKKSFDARGLESQFLPSFGSIFQHIDQSSDQ